MIHSKTLTKQKTEFSLSNLPKKRAGLFLSHYSGLFHEIFIPDGTISIFITKKAAAVLKENKITNLWLTNLMDEETDIDNVPKKI